MIFSANCSLIILLIIVTLCFGQSTYTCDSADVRVVFFTNIRSKTNYPLQFTIFNKNITELGVQYANKSDLIQFESSESTYRRKLIWLDQDVPVIQQLVTVSLEGVSICSYVVTFDQSASGSQPATISVEANFTQMENYNSHLQADFIQSSKSIIIATSVGPLAKDAPCASDTFLDTSLKNWQEWLINGDIGSSLRSQYWEFEESTVVTLKTSAGVTTTLRRFWLADADCSNTGTYKRQLLNMEGKGLLQYLKNEVCKRLPGTCDQIGVPIDYSCHKRSSKVGLGVGLAILFVVLIIIAFFAIKKGRSVYQAKQASKFSRI